jgi:hypothetical protein
MNCCKCGGVIPPLRLKAIPSTKTCVNCSAVERVGGHTIISGKNTYSELQIVPMEVAVELSKKQYRKGYGVSNGVRFRHDHKRN